MNDGYAVESIDNGNVNYSICVVCYLDILGFKEQVKNQHEETIHYWLHRVRDDIAGLCRKTSVKWLMVSDSILLFTSDDSNSFEAMKAIVAAIIPMALSKGLLCRGAISHGEFYFDDDSKIFFGPAYLDAVEYEKRQDWMGVVLTPTCSAYVARHNIDQTLLVDYDVSLKKDRAYRGLFTTITCNYPRNERKRMKCINWINNYAIDNESDRHRLRTEFFQRKQKLTSDQTSKYENTLQFYDYCKSRGHFGPHL